jgi:hypothetical protein
MLLTSLSLVASAVAVGAVAYEPQSVRRKIDLLEHGHPPAGTRIQFSSAELNSWIVDEAHTRVPQGVRNLRLQFGADRANGYGDIDFLKLRQAATGESPGWLMKNLFSGERPVKVSVRFQSAKGRARVDVERVEISGILMEGPALDFVIETFVRPTFPYAIVSEWFDLQYGVDHASVTPVAVTLFIRR